MQEKFMNKNKIFTSIIISLILCASLSLPVFASNSSSSVITRMEKEDFLKGMGVEQEYLELVDDEKINSMYEKYYQNSLNGMKYEWAGYEVFEKDIVDDQSTQERDISNSKLQLTVGYMNQLSGTNIQNVIMEVGYRWLIAPQVRGEDAIAINWESSVLQADGFYAEMGGDYNGSYVSFLYTETPKEKGAGGIGWMVPLSDGRHPGELASNLRGGGSIHMYPTRPIKTTDNVACEFNMKYVHTYASVGVGFSLSGMSVSINPNGASDSLTSWGTWRSNRANN